VPSTRRRALNIAAGAIALALVAAIAVMWPSTEFGNRLGDLGFGSEFYDARVLEIGDSPCAGTDEEDGLRCDDVTLELLQGPDQGDAATLNFTKEDVTSPSFEVGDVVVLSRQPDADPGFEYAFADRNRKPVLAWLAVVFAVAVVLLGRLRGLAALAGLIATFVVLLRFILPAILQGDSPLVVAVVGAGAIAFFAIYLAHGFGPHTTVALLGTLGALAITVAAAQLFVTLADFSGFASEEAIYLNVAQGSINLKGLTLGGIVIGALGAIDDMTVTQASVVAELREADPQMSRARLFTSAMRVGRDHVASTVNTLALAYAGASMPLLVIFVLARQSLGTVANGETVATEIVRTLVGSIGLVAAVPLTTWLAVWAVGGARRSARPRRAATRRTDPFADDD
jgi:uncharacterized membrane protein